MASNSLDQLVTALVPSLSRNLADHFNVFRVMHHGTHEKQLSNVFAWLLRADATHELGDGFQRLFVERVNRSLPADQRLPTSGYRVSQEVDTSGHDALGKDIADIVLTSARASIVVENFELSDGHGHDYHRYLTYGAAGGQQSVVVLLCARRESHGQTNGWEHAVVVTYAELLGGLKALVTDDPGWQPTHAQQNFFINQLIDHFVEVPGAVSSDDRIAFIKTMCETRGIGALRVPTAGAGCPRVRRFGGPARQAAVRAGTQDPCRGEEGIEGLCRQTLVGQVNSALSDRHVNSVQARFVGQWEWCITLRRADSQPTIFLEFRPTAVVENGRVPEPVVDPDYTKILQTRQATEGEGIDLIHQSAVGFDDVLAGLSSDETRLLDTILTAMEPN